MDGIKPTLTYEIHRILEKYLDGRVNPIELSLPNKSKPAFFKIPIVYYGSKYNVEIKVVK